MTDQTNPAADASLPAVASTPQQTQPALQPAADADRSLLIPQSMAEAMHLANLMAASTIVPKVYQGNPSNCLLVIMQAVRWGLDPFMVVQETSIIQEKPMYSGKLVAAVLNTNGGLTDNLSFEYSGSGDERAITVTGAFRADGELREVQVKLKDARTKNDIWNKQPDQQLAYFGARVWARRHAPEVMLGIEAPEEQDGITPPAARDQMFGKITDDQAHELSVLLGDAKMKMPAFKALTGVDKITDIAARDYQRVKTALLQKQQEVGAK